MLDKHDYVTTEKQTIQSAVSNIPTRQKIRDGELFQEIEETELLRSIAKYQLTIED